MKFGAVTKYGKRNKTTTTTKNGDDHMLVNCDAIIVFLIMANLVLSGSRIPDA